LACISSTCPACAILVSGRWFYAFAAWDFAFGVILAVVYYRLSSTEVRGKP
jgi:hypothetical protein